MSKPPTRRRAALPTRKTPRQATSRVAFKADPPGEDDPLLDFEPYRHKEPRGNSITPDLQREFIAHLAATGIVVSAARHIGRSTEALYKLRNRHGAEGFAEAWERAAQRGVLRLEDTALARAIEGAERHVRHGGEVIATERVHNEHLVMFFLKTRLAERYAPEAQIGPGHPVYEKALRAAEEDRRAAANHPDEIKRVQASIDAKVRQWKIELVDEWNAQVRAYNAQNGTRLPVFARDGTLEFDDPPG